MGLGALVGHGRGHDLVLGSDHRRGHCVGALPRWRPGQPCARHRRRQRDPERTLAERFARGEIDHQTPPPGPSATTATPLPAPARAATVDGYTVTLNGNLTAGQEAPLTVTISRNGQSVTDLQPYLDTYAHVTAIHQGDLAFAHLHPEGTTNSDHGGPTLTVRAEMPAPGWNVPDFVDTDLGCQVGEFPES